MALVPEAHVSLIQSHEDQEVEVENERQEFGIRVRVEHVLHNLKQQKSTEILKSTVSIFRSNAKSTFLMVLSMLPFFFFMVFYEFNIHKMLDVASDLLVQPSNTYYYDFGSDKFIFHDENDQSRKRFRNLVQLVPFHLVLSPLIELFGLTIIINIAAELYAGEKESSQSSLKETLYEFLYHKNKLKGPFVTCVLVQLLSTSTLVGLFWTLANHYIITSGIYYYNYFPRDTYMNMLSVGIHALLFVALLYKYLDWSAMWNMGIVISVLEEETGVDALEMSGFFGKHSRKTGFLLMLVSFAYGVGVRLPLLLVGVDDVNVIVIASVLVLLCLGNLVKWVAFVVYYHECKSQIMLKKDDEEVGKAVKTAVV